jgi:Uri superfamily endonuclease
MTGGAFCSCADAIPAAPGAYVLAVELVRPLTVALPGRAAARLQPGCYLYCGSAGGPGGLRARIGRHMRRGKSIRWHIDRLTEPGAVRGAWVFPGGDECALAAALSKLPAPIAGFGSSDCARCRSHLFRWPRPDAATIAVQNGPHHIIKMSRSASEKDRKSNVAG